ncbi:unnamed protein product [Cuscuta campestris]|uniref:Uncharacterized protein n=1 Tax=Cuscuta campestris TaxID=132261 RepID=A0A484LHS3_9ASTE|nr:unnamed protein product [Cuscuta campestris]
MNDLRSPACQRQIWLDSRRESQSTQPQRVRSYSHRFPLDDGLWKKLKSLGPRRSTVGQRSTAGRRSGYYLPELERCWSAGITNGRSGSRRKMR